MFPKALRFLWGDLTSEELKKFGILSLIIMLILGNYWMLRSTKNAIFNVFVGYREWQPVAKIISVIAMIFIVLGYSKLVDLFEKDKLFYILCSLYGFSFILLGYSFAYPNFTLIGPNSFLYPLVSWIPGKVVGWVSYVLLESYGSILVALFYSFVASVMTTSSAKRGYGMMAFLTQIGTITGSVITSQYAESMGISTLFAIGGIIILTIPFIIKYYMKAIPQENIETPTKKVTPKTGTGFWEGLKILLTKPYVMGIFVVATVYEIIATIIEYQMNWIASGIYPSQASMAAFNAKLAIGINCLALIVALVGTSFFMRRFGLKACLITFPSAIGIIVGLVYLVEIFGATDYHLMWVLFAATIAIRSLNYAFNKPSMEVMYIPTSKDIKFKAKGWIDTFGSRSTKGIGATISNSLKHSLPNLLIYGSLVSLGIIAVWIFIAAFVGTSFNKLQKDGTIVE